MPIIKREVDMNLPELIEWITENDITYRQYIPKLAENTRFIAVNGYGEMRIYEFVRPDDVFTVEIEEEITEDTVLPKLVTRTVKGHYGLFIKESINNLKLINFNAVEAFYIPNDDLTMTLIWKNGKLVD